MSTNTMTQEEAISVIVDWFPPIGNLNEFSQENLAKFFIRETIGESDREKTINFVRHFEAVIRIYEDAGRGLYEDIWFQTYESTFNSLVHCS